MENELYRPLADRMRPKNLQEFVGQKHILGTNKPLYLTIMSGNLHSMIFWGAPGTGKTTLAKLIANHSNACFIALSAVFSGVKEIRDAIKKAQENKDKLKKRTVLFIDEVHRFNKSQQDAFLPYVEDGTVIFIGATTENPSFELNNALLSRARVYVLKQHSVDEIILILKNAIKNELNSLIITEKQLHWLAEAADGDARQALTLLEIAAGLAVNNQMHDDVIKQVCSGNIRRFDKQGEYFYDLISALHKSVRGSDPNAALYWFARILDGGCEPLYIARRVLRMASEDIGNADPRALSIALDAWQTQERLGSPEGELAIAQAVVYMACAAKSNAVYKAFSAAMQDVKNYGSLEVPLPLRNAPTKLMKEIDYGKNYRYAHDEPEAYAAGEKYFPDEMPEKNYYQPVSRGLEIKIKEKLAYLKSLDQKKKT